MHSSYPLLELYKYITNVLFKLSAWLYAVLSGYNKAIPLCMLHK